jgi:hypothetical protein
MKRTSFDKSGGIMAALMLGALRALLVLLFAGAVAAQVAGYAVARAVLGEDAAVVVAVLAVAGLVCVEVVLVCVWALAPLARDGRIFEAERRPDRWVRGAVAALAIGAALATVGLGYLLVSGAASTPAGATVAVLAAAVAAAAAALALLVDVMRRLLHRATGLHDELAEVV